jgi:hypothetical protein
VGDAPEDGLGAACDVDLAVDGADVGLDGVGAEVGECGDLGVAAALGDQGEDLRGRLWLPVLARKMHMLSCLASATVNYVFAKDI